MKFLGTLLGVSILIAGSYGGYRLLLEYSAADEPAEPEVETMVAVQVAKVSRMTLHGYIHAYGVVEVDPGSAKSIPASVKITASAEGMITEANCVEGQQVREGDILFRIDSRLTDAAIEKVRQTVAFAEKNFERQQRLLKVEGTSDKLYLEAQEALAAARAEQAALQVEHDKLAVPAPLSGTIVRLSAKTGETVVKAQELAELHDIGRVVVTAMVPASEVNRLEPGQTVQINTGKVATPSSDPEQGTIGVLDYIDPEVDPRTDTVAVRIPVPVGCGLRPGQFVAMRIVFETREGCLAVPRSSVYTDHDGQSTLSIVEGDVARQQIVTVGLRNREFIQVEGDGLREGATVVTLGSYALPGETRVHVMDDSTQEGNG